MFLTTVFLHFIYLIYYSDLIRHLFKHLFKHFFTPYNLLYLKIIHLSKLVFHPFSKLQLHIFTELFGVSPSAHPPDVPGLI